MHSLSSNCSHQALASRLLGACMFFSLLAGCGPSQGSGSIPPDAAPATDSGVLQSSPSGQTALYSYCDPTSAIAHYPRFGAQVPEVVARLYPSGGGRDYPVIDAHTHLSTSRDGEAALQKQVGIYAAVHAAWDAASTPALRETYPAPNVIQFNLGAFLSGFDESQVSSVLAGFDRLQSEGAGGIKLFKDLGLGYNDSSGARLRIDDPRLKPLWQRAGEKKWTISMHVADPDSWMSSRFPNSPYSKQDLVRQFIRMVEDNPTTVFVAIHLLDLMDSTAELDQLTGYLDRYPNLYADTSARSQYLVNLDQAKVREFMVRNQDKLIFATDRVGEGAANYEEELRYWETDQPTRTFYLNGQSRGLKLPPEVLEKLYYRNALRAFCGHLS